MRTFWPRPWATTVALTLAPDTKGAPTFTPSPSPSMSTLSKDTAAPTSADSNSTFTCSPDFTRYCLPPVWITAYMAGPVLKLCAKTWNYKGFHAARSKAAVLISVPCGEPSLSGAGHGGHAARGSGDPRPARLGRGAGAPGRRLHRHRRRQAPAAVPGAACGGRGRVPGQKRRRRRRRAALRDGRGGGIHPYRHAAARRRRGHLRNAAWQEDGERRIRQRGGGAGGGLPLFAGVPDDAGRRKHARYAGAPRCDQQDRGRRSTAAHELPRSGRHGGRLPGGDPAKNRETFRSRRAAWRGAGKSAGRG